MVPDINVQESGTAALDRPQPAVQRRHRVILSCGPCRSSKLKCDREQPCNQCVKKGTTASCQYVPRPEKKKRTKGMAARLQRLEGMVRDMMDSEQKASTPKDGSKPSASPMLTGQVVQGERATTYVGATHIMAMLEDIEDLKNYFEDEEDCQVDDSLEVDILLQPSSGPRNRDELLARLPERSIADRLIMRYFTCMSPSQHIVHRPAFTREYFRFWQDPTAVSLHWIAQLFIMLSHGLYFNQFSAPHEVVDDSPVPIKDRIKEYKDCAGWALIRGKYTQPNIATLRAFLLYVESDFMFRRSEQMNCYALSAVCLRLMLKMGFHRDPDKLANISPFESEMRRRMWNMAVQVELVVSFHMGLPSMIFGIDSDTDVPRNLWDEDFDEDAKELPPGRPLTEYTAVSYAINKTKILRVFGRIARQAHSLKTPTYQEVMALDEQLEKVWKDVPSLIKARPLEECAGEASSVLIQRFGITALYHKSCCVLHRRYLAEPIPREEHNYSRKKALESAITLLDFQYIIWEGCKPGRLISDKGWYVSSLAVHDYLLAGMIVYIVIQNDGNWEAAGTPMWMQQLTKRVTRDELKSFLARSHYIWSDVATNAPELKKTADALATMLNKIGYAVTDYNPSSFTADKSAVTATAIENSPGNSSSAGQSSGMGSSAGLWDPLQSEYSDSSSGIPNVALPSGDAVIEAMPSLDPLDLDINPSNMIDTLNFDPSWVSSESSMDWRFLDISLAQSHAGENGRGSLPTFMQRMPVDSVGTSGIDDWLTQSDMTGSGPGGGLWFDQ